MKNEELQQLTEKLSIELFHRPFKHDAFFNPRLRTTGGRYMLKSHNIEINRKYYEEYGLDELIGIIKHELCHYHLHIEGKGYQHRDRDFKELMKRVGAPRHCTPLKETVQRRARIYICTKCTQKYERKRRVDLSRFVCGKCHGKLKEVVS